MKDEPTFKAEFQLSEETLSKMTDPPKVIQLDNGIKLYITKWQPLIEAGDVPRVTLEAIMSER